MARGIEGSTKAELLLERLRRHYQHGEKVLVFTAFRQTLDTRTARLEREGVPAAVYHGSLSRRAEEAAVAAFRDQAPVLLSISAMRSRLARRHPAAAVRRDRAAVRDRRRPQGAGGVLQRHGLPRRGATRLEQCRRRGPHRPGKS
ncbi:MULTISPECIES: helicase-related protein [Streptomyces]|uniref:helicase-related protein n=1 Tax=Streptomyces lycopersici TaxID=2974589 RepID=UPI0035240A66